MKRIVCWICALAICAAAGVACESRAVGATNSPAAQAKEDAISGDWNISFQVQGMEVGGTMTLKLEGAAVTGKVETEHTGPGTLRNGSFSDNKLSMRMEFASHEPIEATAVYKDGKLTGEFKTEGNTGTWIGTRK